MARADIERVDAATVAKWPRPLLRYIPEAQRPAYLARQRALCAVMSGASVASAARRHRVHRGTLTRIVINAVQLASDGKAWGFRACLHYFRAEGRAPDGAPPEVPLTARPHAFSQVVKAVAELGTLIADFTGALPHGRTKSPAFNALFARALKLLRSKGLEHRYPLNAKDHGRAALLEFIQRQRIRAGQTGIGETPPSPSKIVRLDQVFKLWPFARLEFDAHREDIKWCIEVPTPDGGWKVTRISMIWFLVLLDAATRLIVGWTLVVGRGYRQFDVMHMLAEAMQPWRPRATFMVPDMHYAEGAGMPSLVMPDGLAPRGLLLASDNYSSHQARFATEAILQGHLGVANWGEAHVPEHRPWVEAFFHHIEAGALRRIAGGYFPATGFRDNSRRANAFNPNRHPLNYLALHELMEVIVTGYNATNHRGLFDRSPLEALSQYVQRGGWLWESSLSERHAETIGLLHIPITIRGHRPDRQPYAEWKGATYRSESLHDRWDLVGKTFPATVPYRDLRVLTLLRKGHTYLRLGARPPWQAAHDIRLREQVIAWDHSKVIKIAGADDAVRSFHDYVRATARTSSKSTDLYARHQAVHLASPATAAAPTTPKPIRPPREPRSGWITADETKDR